MNGLPSTAGMRCLMTTDSVGGVWTYSLELCRELGRHGVEVVLAVMGAPLRLEQRQAVARLPHVSVAESCYRLEWMDAPWSDVDMAGEWLRTLESDFNPDIVHLNGYSHAAIPFGCPRVVVAHSCVCSWWRAVKGEPAPRGWDEYRRRVRAGLASADLLVAPTVSMLMALVAEHGELGPAMVIRNGRNPLRFRPGLKDRFILGAGRWWDEAKNVGSLGNIAGRLPWPVRLAGDVIHPEGRTVPQDPNVEWLGRLEEDELATWMSRASVFVAPARYEPFGLSVLEAALSGCALVLGDIPSQRELWHGAARFVDPADSEALRREVLALTEDPLACGREGAAARERAMTMTARRMGVAYASAYAALAGVEARVAPLPAPVRRTTPEPFLAGRTQWGIAG